MKIIKRAIRSKYYPQWNDLQTKENIIVNSDPFSGFDTSNLARLSAIK